MKPIVFLPIVPFVFVAAAAATSPRTDQTVHETSQVDLVEIPVNVIGRDGHPLRGLTQADFEVDDEGRAQKITAFDIVDLKRNSIATDPSEAMPEAARRHFLFLFDFSFATPNEIVHSRLAALDFIEHQMDPDDRAGIAMTSVESGPRLLVNFTADRKQLVAALRSLGLPKMMDHERDPLAFAFTIPGDPHLKDLIAPGESSDSLRTFTDAEADSIAAIKVFANMAQKTADAYAESRVSRHLGEMGGLASALDTIQGTKRIIYFSEGFDGRLIFGSLTKTQSDVIGDNDAMAHGEFWALDVDKRYLNSPLEREMSQTMELFRRSDCVVYAVDIAHLRADGDASMGQQTDGKESLFLFAHETGGDLIQSSNDLASALRRIEEKTSLTYVLSFSPAVRLGDGKFHRLKVRVRKPGARVSARAGYYEARNFHVLTPLERALATADVINRDQPRGDLPIELLAVPFADERMSKVPVVLAIPPIPPSSGERVRLGVYVYVTDAAGQLADYFTRTLTLDKKNAKFADGGITYYSICRLLPGSYRVRAFVRDEETGRFGFRVASIEVPAFAEREMHALPPLFMSEPGSGINLRDSGSGSGEPSEPFQVGESVFVPRIVPRLLSGVASRVCLMLYQREQGSTSAPFELSAEIRDESGRVRGTAQMSLVGRSSPDSAGLVKLLVNFVPSNLPAGDYSLRVLFRDAQDKSLHSESEAKFRVS
jgi:VWFA-related protein